jgi:methylated-DNA-[protein]-cysteine S-methyltransferase
MSEYRQKILKKNAIFLKNKEELVNSYFYKIMKSPVGELTLIASDKGLAAVLWENDDPVRVRLAPRVLDEKNQILLEAKRQLEEYFNGDRKNFDLPIDFHGTDFQKSVWQALLKIPYGSTTSYGRLALKLKRPKAARAVGAANGKNPVSIIAACHRVIGASGALTGFAGGLEAKAFLLNLEKQH